MERYSQMKVNKFEGFHEVVRKKGQERLVIRNEENKRMKNTGGRVKGKQEKSQSEFTASMSGKNLKLYLNLQKKKN